MSECYFCRYSGGNHDVACPKSIANENPEAAEWDWRAGYQLGKAGEEKPAKSSPAFDLGFHRGEVALEETQNGYQSWGY